MGAAVDQLVVMSSTNSRIGGSIAGHMSVPGQDIGHQISCDSRKFPLAEINLLSPYYIKILFMV